MAQNRSQWGECRFRNGTKTIKNVTKRVRLKDEEIVGLVI